MKKILFTLKIGKKVLFEPEGCLVFEKKVSGWPDSKVFFLAKGGLGDPGMGSWGGKMGILVARNAGLVWEGKLSKGLPNKVWCRG